ncbi:acyl-CoA synthetase [Mycobacterium sp. NAZ190054]|uniref:acyl-CoA synthetase n=1 Tax=Mycobacterium sp. NAZ190054 TaxID=1747766 RepID=UPI00079837F3|nr:acyl-CoA synthetase [Mycobacterium sp. NAZ190054]KWX59895.1 acyl-CoA synthetase [Mycobacterium sp. NAZ190054]
MTSPLLRSLTGAHDSHTAAVTVGDAGLSREDLLGAATALADRIAGAAVAAIDARADLSTIVAVVGCLLADVAAVPVPPDSGHRERAHILTDSGAQLWIGEAAEGISLPTLQVELGARSSTTYPEADPSRPALIIYTSGTTGAPKGAVLSRRALAASLDGLADAWQWSEDDTLVHGLPLFHVHGLVLGVLGALRFGSPLIHTVRPKPEAYAAAAGSLYFGVPTVWSRVCADPAVARRLGSARLLVSGSAPLPVPTFTDLTALTGSAPIERYGMTETVITVSTRHDGDRRPGWVGEPLAGVTTRLRAETGEPAPWDGKTLGELEIAGPTLFDEYLNSPDKTASVMTGDGWFRTGDIAVIDPDGYHRIVGRASVDMIKSGGYRIGAGEVEHALLSFPGVREAAVVGVPDDDLGQRIVAFLVGDISGDQAVSDHVAQTLSVHKRPREIRVVDALPRNPMGKVQKKLLLESAQ